MHRTTIRKTIRRAVPSMFHRRLLLLGILVLGMWMVLAAQLARLTLAEGAVRQGKVQAALVRRRLIPTSRGRILDRRMRVLAADRASNDIGVRYPVLTGGWAYDRARRAAYRADRSAWREMSYDQRAALISQHQGVYNQQVEQLWQQLCEMGGITHAQLEQRKTTILRRVKGIASDVWAKRMDRQGSDPDGPVTFEAVAQPVGEQREAHAILRAVDPLTIAAVGRLIVQADQDPQLAVWKQVVVRPSRERHYPMESMNVFVDRRTFPSPLRSESMVELTIGGVGLHLIGQSRQVWKQDVQRRPFRRVSNQGQERIDLGGYLPGDSTGQWGVERSQEDHLRGERGQVAMRLDTSKQVRQEPTAGRDVILTIDLLLQARIQALLDPRLGLTRVQPWHSKNPPKDPTRPALGQPLNAAVVVLDIAQSQILAAVSTPTFTLDQLHDDPASVWNDQLNRPFINRPFAQPYQPGSTVKPLVLAAAITDGAIQIDHQITCKGHLDPNAPNRYRCWIYKMYGSTHGPLGPTEAIARSCNIYFYTLGRLVGARGLVDWYGRLGLGRSTHSGVPGEVAGDLPNVALAEQPNAPGFSGSDAIFMAIGQGPIRWTLIQAASAYATLARGGYWIQPTLILNGGSTPTQISHDTNLNPDAVRIVMEGLKKAVTKRYGSAHHIALLGGEPIFNIKGVELYGKSGTAQAVPHWIDQDGDRRFTRGVDRIVRRGDHAWIICLVQRPKSPHPDFVVAVVVEYGGSGGAVAGPIANQILHAMRAEGYL